MNNLVLLKLKRTKSQEKEDYADKFIAYILDASQMNKSWTVL